MREAPVAGLARLQFAIFEVAFPGRPTLPAGIFLWDQAAGQARTRFRRDFHLIADEESLAVLSVIEADMEAKLLEFGPELFAGWAAGTLSNFLLVTDTEDVVAEPLDRALMRLYRKHVPSEVQRFETHLPRVNLAAAAGSWGAAMTPEASSEWAEDWIEVSGDYAIDDRMFIVQVTGRSMEPQIADGSLCIFRSMPAGSRKGRRLLIENLADSEQRYTVKRYSSEKRYDAEGGFAHTRIVLEPLNPEFEPWELREGDEARVVGEFIRVLE